MCSTVFYTYTCGHSLVTTFECGTGKCPMERRRRHGHHRLGAKAGNPMHTSLAEPCHLCAGPVSSPPARSIFDTSPAADSDPDSPSSATDGGNTGGRPPLARRAALDDDDDGGGGRAHRDHRRPTAAADADPAPVAVLRGAAALAIVEVVPLRTARLANSSPDHRRLPNLHIEAIVDLIGLLADLRVATGRLRRQSAAVLRAVERARRQR